MNSFSPYLGLEDDTEEVDKIPALYKAMGINIDPVGSFLSGNGAAPMQAKPSMRNVASVTKKIKGPLSKVSPSEDTGSSDSPQATEDMDLKSMLKNALVKSDENITNAKNYNSPELAYTLGAILTKNPVLQKLAGQQYETNADKVAKAEQEKQNTGLKYQNLIDTRSEKMMELKAKLENARALKEIAGNQPGSIKEDNLIGRTSKNWDEDKMFNSIDAVDQSINKAQSLLKKAEAGKLTIDDPLFHDLELDYVNALRATGTAKSTGNERESQQANTLEQKLNRLQNLITSKPNEIHLPEYQKNISVAMADLIETNAAFKEARIAQKLAGVDSYSSERVKKMIYAKADARRNTHYADKGYTYGEKKAGASKALNYDEWVKAGKPKGAK